jgi:hypothetical protein
VAEVTEQSHLNSARQLNAKGSVGRKTVAIIGFALEPSQADR